MKLDNETRWWNRWLINFILFLLGASALSISIFVMEAGALATLVKSISEIILGATLISVVFSWINDRYVIRLVQDSLSPVLSDILSPMVDTTLETADKNYYWDCYLTHGPNDFPGYYTQEITLKYIAPKVGAKLYGVSNVGIIGEIFSDFYADPDCLIRWKIDTETENLDVMDERVFKVHRISVGGQALSSIKQKSFKLQGSPCARYEATVPKHLQAENQEIEIHASFLKPGAEDNFLIVRSSLFRNATRVEAKLLVDKGLGFSRCAHNVSEATALLNEGSPKITNVRSSDEVSRNIVFDYPLKKGSSFLFELHKTLGTKPEES